MKTNLASFNTTEKRIPFDFEKLPQAFFTENPESKKLRRKLLVKNLTMEESIDPEKLSQIFYSSDNMEIINKQLVLYIYKKTNGKIRIPFQSESDLMVVMRWVYVNYARNLPFKIKEQINELNKEVVSQISPNIISQAQQYVDYIRDITLPREPLPPPVNSSKDNTLPSLSEIYHGKTN